MRSMKTLSTEFKIAVKMARKTELPEAIEVRAVKTKKALLKEIDKALGKVAQSLPEIVSSHRSFMDIKAPCPLVSAESGHDSRAIKPLRVSYEDIRSLKGFNDLVSLSRDANIRMEAAYRFGNHEGYTNMEGMHGSGLEGFIHELVLSWDKNEKFSAGTVPRKLPKSAR